MKPFSEVILPQSLFTQQILHSVGRKRQDAFLFTKLIVIWRTGWVSPVRQIQTLSDDHRHYILSTQYNEQLYEHRRFATVADAHQNVSKFTLITPWDLIPQIKETDLMELCWPLHLHSPDVKSEYHLPFRWKTHSHRHHLTSCQSTDNPSSTENFCSDQGLNCVWLHPTPDGKGETTDWADMG